MCGLVIRYPFTIPAHGSLLQAFFCNSLDNKTSSLNGIDVMGVFGCRRYLLLSINPEFHIAVHLVQWNMSIVNNWCSG